MRVTRSRLIAAAAVLLAVAGGALAAASFASGHHPAAVKKAAAGSAQRTFVSAASGNDANPCTRTAPCRNFQAAIAQTASGGEVIVLDSGGYGTVTITQAVSIVAPPGVYAGVTVFSGYGITISAGPSDTVTIRGLTLNGLGGLTGIVFNSGAALYVEDSVFTNFDSYEAISAATTASADVVVEDSTFTRAGDGIFLSTSSGNTLRATIEHCRFQDDAYSGVYVSSNSNAVVRDSVASGNAGPGFATEAATGHLDVENSLTTHNGEGVSALTGSVRVSETTIEENTTGLHELSGGTITSFGNNRVAGNTTNGSFSSTIPLQ